MIIAFVGASNITSMFYQWTGETLLGALGSLIVWILSFIVIVVISVRTSMKITRIFETDKQKERRKRQERIAMLYEELDILYKQICTLEKRIEYKKNQYENTDTLYRSAVKRQEHKTQVKHDLADLLTGLENLLKECNEITTQIGDDVRDDVNLKIVHLENLINQTDDYILFINENKRVYRTKE